MKRFSIVAALGGALVAAPAVAGGWRVVVKDNPMNDTARVAAQVDGEGASLVLWCESGRKKPDVQAEIHTDEYIGSDDHYSVAYRVDKGKPVEEDWRYVSGPHGTVIAPATLEDLREFVSLIEPGQKLVVQAETFERNAQPITRTIAIGGVAETLAALRSKCASQP